MCGRALAPISDGVCFNAISLAATVTILASQSLYFQINLETGFLGLWSRQTSCAEPFCGEFCLFFDVLKQVPIYFSY